MVNKIDDTSTYRPKVGETNQHAKLDRSQNTDTRSSSPTRSDQISLTSSAQLLKELGDTISASPDTDQSRVQAIRQALADGSYDLSASRIADKLLNLEDQL